MPPALGMWSLNHLTTREVPIVVLSDTIVQSGSIDIYRTFYPKPAEYKLFSSAHGMFSRIDYMLDHKTSFNKFKRIELISSIFSTTMV